MADVRNNRDLVIAVDGPAASGKGTIARALAKHFDLPYLDTGLLYRAVGHAVRLSGAELKDGAAASRIASKLDMAILADPALRSREAGEAASIVSSVPDVRDALFQQQRRFAAQEGGAVLDGRDIGTVIAPEADAKLFVTASLDARAARRHAELIKQNAAITLVDVREDLAARDARDRSREAAPLTVAEDAFVLDTTTLSIDDAISAAIEAVKEAVRRGR